jgi:phosphate/sulfate permease
MDSWEGLYLGEMKAQRVILLVGGLVLILVGVLWTLQGLGMVGGSVMSGVTLWAIVGPIVALVGAYLMWRASRRTPSRAGSSDPPTPSS